MSIVHPKTGHSAKYSVRGLDGIMVGMRVELQPLLVTEQPLCIVSYTAEGAERSFEIAPVVFDEAGFDLSAPVFGKAYKRPPETAREKRQKEAETPAALESAMGAAHSFIQPKSPFLSQTEGAAVSVAETVRVSEILISATEAAKRYRAETGDVPDGFIPQLRKEYPEGVPTTAANALIAEWKAGNRPERDFGTAVITGGGKAAGNTAFMETEEGADADAGAGAEAGAVALRKLA